MTSRNSPLSLRTSGASKMIFVSGGIGQNLIDDLLRRLAKNRLTGSRIVRLADGRKQDPEIIVNLGRGRDGRPGIGSGAALLDRDRRRQAFDEVDIRFFHLVEKLPGIGRKAFHIAALAFGIKGVEGEGRFAGAAQAR